MAGTLTGITHLYAGVVLLGVTTAASAPSVGPRVRQARRADLLAVYRIEQASFPQPWPFAAFEQYAGQPGFLVAQDDDIVGYVVADTTPAPAHGESIGHIKDLAVREDRRGEGIGSLLLARAVEILGAQVDAVKLEVRESNETAIALYRTHGFEYRQTAPEYYDNGEDAFVFVRPV